MKPLPAGPLQVRFEDVRFAYGLLLPAMKSELAWTYAQAGWLNTANALGYIAGALLTMLLIRRYEETMAELYLEGKLPPHIQQGLAFDIASSPVPGVIRRSTGSTW